MRTTHTHPGGKAPGGGIAKNGGGPPGKPGAPGGGIPGPPAMGGAAYVWGAPYTVGAPLDIAPEAPKGFARSPPDIRSLWAASC